MCYRHLLSVKHSAKNATGVSIVGMAALLVLRFLLKPDTTHAVNEVRADKYKSFGFLDCTAVDTIEIVRILDNGVALTSYLGKYKNTDVVLKIPRRNSTLVEDCMEATEQSQKTMERRESWCTTEVLMRLMREILFLKKLKHPNLIRLLGTCMRGEAVNGDPVISRHDIAVYEYAPHFRVEQALQRPWKDILHYALQLANLLFYLERSPIGSVLVKNLSVGQFLFLDDTVKLADVFGMLSVEPKCRSSYDHTRLKDGLPDCDLEIPCQNRTCRGYNAKLNMKQFHDLLFNKLLDPAVYPAPIKEEIGDVYSKLNRLTINASSLRDVLNKITK